jgi:hypothetical protein
LAIQLSPLIGGPAWLPVHCKVIVDDSHIFDFIPLNATSTETIHKLISLQKVPATVRIIEKNERGEIGSSLNNLSEEVDELTKRAVLFCQEYDQDLHLIDNNCWSFCFDLVRNVTHPESLRRIS